MKEQLLRNYLISARGDFHCMLAPLFKAGISIVSKTVNCSAKKTAELHCASRVWGHINFEVQGFILCEVLVGEGFWEQPSATKAPWDSVPC
jgi:hypothetical protein